MDDVNWAAVGALLSAIAVLVTIVIFLRQRQRKRLSYRVVVDQRVVSVATGYSSRVSVAFDGQQLDNVSLTVLRIANSGNVPIVPDDYYEPLTIKFDDNTTGILEADGGSDAAAVPPRLSFTEQAVELVPMLLNPGDHITVRLLRRGGPARPRVTGRVCGVRTIENVDAPFSWRLRIVGALLGSLAIGVAASVALVPAYGIAYLLHLFQPAIRNVVSSVFLAILFAALVFVGSGIGTEMLRDLRRGSKLR